MNSGIGPQPLTFNDEVLFIALAAAETTDDAPRVSSARIATLSSLSLNQTGLDQAGNRKVEEISSLVGGLSR